MKAKTTLLAAVILICGWGLHAQSSTKETKTNLILSSVKSYLGTPYQYGGMSRKGIDCSALLYLSFNQAGIQLPRASKDQSKFGKNVKWGRIKPGDLVFFKFTQKGENSWHSGVIVTVEKEKIKFIHASSSKGVIESDLNSTYYKTNVRGFRRVI